MKKGFTLAELIGVLVVLALIGMIAVPAVAETIKNNKKNICNIQFNNIIEEAKSWGANNIDKLPKENGSIDVTFADLIKYGYTEDSLVDPKTKEPFSENWKIIITKISGRFEYKIYNGTNYIDPEKYCG